MYSKPKNSKEKAWLQTVVDFASRTTWLNDTYGGHCMNPLNFEIDHIIGAQAKRKINGVTTKVGEYAIMPIPYELHNISCDHSLNRTLRPASFRKQFGNEVIVWKSMIDYMEGIGLILPFDDDMIGAIMR